MKSKSQKVALTGGIVWGLTMFLTTLLAVFTGYGIAFLKVMQSIYPGYSLSVGGSFVGLIYGFLDVYLGIYIISWVYKQLK